MDTNAYWLEIGVSPREIHKFNGSNWSSLRSVIQANLNALDDILKLLSVKEIDLKNNKKMRELANKPSAKVLWGLHKFSQLRDEAIKEYHLITAKNETDEALSRYPFALTLKDYLLDKNLLIDISYFAKYRATRTQEVWSLDPVLTDVDAKALADSTRLWIVNANQILRRKTNLRYTFKINSDIILCFERAKRESVQEGFGERVPLLLKGQFFFKISVLDNTFEIRAMSDKRAVKIAQTVLESRKIKLYVPIKEIVKFDPSELINKLLTVSTDDIRLKSVELINMQKSVDCNVKFIQHDNSKNVLNSLQELIKDGYLDIKNYKAIKRLIFEHKDVEIPITVINEDDVCSFKLLSVVPEHLKVLITKQLKDNYGVCLNVEYSSKELTSDIKRHHLESIIGKWTSQLSETDKKVYNELKNLDVFKEIRSNRTKCSLYPNDTNHGTQDEASTICDNCGASVIRFESRQLIEIDPVKYMHYLLKRLESVYGQSYVSIVKKISSTAPIIEVRHYDVSFLIIPQFARNCLSLIRYATDKKIPFIKIHNGATAVGKTKMLSDLSLIDCFYQTDLEIKKIIDSLMQDTIQKKIKEEYDTAITELRNLIPNGLKGKPSECGEHYEEIVAPIMKTLFIELIHLGKNNKGTRVPDGIYGFRMSPSKRNAFSLIYDCKFSNTEYDLDAGTKLSARSYVKRTQQSKALQEFSTNLKTYAIIGNKINVTQFQNLSTELQLYKKWKGKALLIPSSILLELVEAFNTYHKSQDHKISFNLGFVKFVSELQEKTFVLTSDSIAQIIRNATECHGIINIPDIVRHLESNIEY